MNKNMLYIEIIFVSLKAETTVQSLVSPTRGTLTRVRNPAPIKQIRRSIMHILVLYESNHRLLIRNKFCSIIIILQFFPISK
jgi:hypothetical protein